MYDYSKCICEYYAVKFNVSTNDFTQLLDEFDFNDNCQF